MISAQDVFAEIHSEQLSDGAIVAHWLVPDDLPYLNGHFPGNPVVPAVGIVDASFHVVRAHHSNPNLRLSGVPSAKFMNPVVPRDEVTIEARSQDGKTWQVEWKDKASQKLWAQLRLMCTS